MLIPWLGEPGECHFPGECHVKATLRQGSISLIGGALAVLSTGDNVKRYRLLIADDHTLVLEGLKKILEADFDLVGLAENGRDLVRMADELNPDVVLVDISMPLLNGIDAARQLLKHTPQAKVIFVTMHADADYVAEAFRAGAAGYLLKRSAASELVTAIHEVMKGRYYVTPLVTREALHPLFSAMPESRKLSSTLTSRQREVLQLVAEGNSVKKIVAILRVSPKTVEYHKTALMDRLGIHTTAELTRYAIEHGLVAD
jgi:DNA-binding NarL/FixJ family response regulator